MDRLAELKKDLKDESKEDIELCNISNRTNFLNKIDNIKNKIEILNNITKELIYINDEIQRNSSNNYTGSVDKNVKKGNTYIINIKHEINLYDRDNINDKISKNLIMYIRKIFLDSINNFKDIQIKINIDSKNKVKRQIRNINPTITDEQINNVLSSPDKLLQETILTGDIKIQNSCKKVTDKYSSILLLEGSINELNQMFIDLAVIVDNQGNLLENIQNNIMETTENIDIGNTDLTKSIEYLKDIRKKQCCVASIIIIIVVILIIIIVTKIQSISR